MNNFVQGICEDLCPQAEAKLRIKEKLLNFYEFKDVQKRTPGTLVKSFSRSAAGIKLPRKHDLRSEKCLERTLTYLLKDVLLDKRKPYNFVYDFIFDRLRAVRQEIVMQNFNERQVIKLLEPIIMFLAYSRYRLCEESIDNFDPKICDQHLQECLKRVLCCYDVININDLNLNELKSRNFIEALYQIFNLGSTIALERSIKLPLETRRDAHFKNAWHISMSFAQGNLFRVFKSIETLPHILSAIASLKLPQLRRQLYLLFAHAYHSKQLTVPAPFVCSLTLHANINELLLDCKYYNLQIKDKKSINFVKTDFNMQQPALKPKREAIVEDKLKLIYLPEILLMKKI